MRCSSQSNLFAGFLDFANGRFTVWSSRSSMCILPRSSGGGHVPFGGGIGSLTSPSGGKSCLGLDHLVVLLPVRVASHMVAWKEPFRELRLEWPSVHAVAIPQQRKANGSGAGMARACTLGHSNIFQPQLSAQQLSIAASTFWTTRLAQTS